MQLLKNASILSMLVGTMTLNGPHSTAAELLTIGSDAPKLDIEHWVQDGKGKFKPVTDFQKGKVYVVEFWATWCGPCIASMPHLAELQGTYADKGVQIVSISDEELETVEKFLDREVSSRRMPKADSDEESAEQDKESKQTYRDLTSAYCLTTDPDQSSYESYMVAAAQNGIPTAFIVGKDAKVEWIGHPMSMDEPLAAVVDGSWDRDAFAEEMRAQQEAEKVMNDIYMALQKQEFDAALEQIDAASANAGEDQQMQLQMLKLQVLMEKKDVDGALKIVDELIEKAGEDQQIQLRMVKLQVLVVAKKLPEANEQANKIFTEMADEPQAVNAIAWNLYEMAAQGQLAKGELLDTAMTAARAAIDKVPAEEKWSVMDTVAHIAFVNGKIDEAIAIEQAAQKLVESDDDRQFIESFLEELYKAKKEAKAEPLSETAK